MGLDPTPPLIAVAVKLTPYRDKFLHFSVLRNHQDHTLIDVRAMLMVVRF